MQQTIEYNEERKTWNLFVDGEWYFEGDYETCSDMMFNNAADEDEEYDDMYEYTGNMPCDDYGMCAGSSCSNYPRCQGWVK